MASSFILATTTRRLSPCLIGAFVSVALVACEPPRALVPDTVVVPEDTGVEPMDSGVLVDTGVDVQRPDVRIDVTLDTGCDPDMCDNICIPMGAVVGRCRMGVCGCVFQDSGVVVTDGRADVPSESSIRGCMTNADCPSTMFCSASSCTGPGSCALRQEQDAAACPASPNRSCGCDGVFYPSVCARTAVGVRQDPAARCGTDASVLTDASMDGG